MSIKWGVLGTGGIAREFIADIESNTEMSVAAIGSRNTVKAQEFKKEFPNINFCGSYEELVNSDVDAIYVATPHQAHVTNTILALTAKKPVLCEKPFSVNAIEARAMVEAARENQVLLMEAMWTRYLPHIQKVRELLSELGEIQVVEADHGQSLLHIKRLTDPNYAGGALLDLGIYPISFAFMVLGKPASITAKANVVNGVDHQTSAIFEYENGAQAMINTNMVAKSPTRAAISGSKARLELDTSFYRPTNMRAIYHDGRTIEFANGYRGHGLREQAIYFEKLLIQGRLESELLSLEETVSIMETMDQIRAQINLIYPFEQY